MILKRAARLFAKRPTASAHRSYSDQRPDVAAQVQMTELRETFDMVPLAILLPVVAAAGLVPVFWDSDIRDILILLAIGVCVICLGATILARVGGPSLGSEESVESGRQSAWIAASLLGLAFGTIPVVLLATADPSQRPLVFGAVAVLVAGVVLAGPILIVGLPLLGLLLLGTCIGILRAGGAAAPMSVVVVVCLAIVLGAALFRQRDLTRRRLGDALRVDDLGKTMDTLLLDFDAGSDDWLFDLDVDRRIRGASPFLVQASGRSAEALEGCRFVSLFVDPRAVRLATADRKPFRNEVVEVITDGPPVWWRISGRPIYDGGGRFAGYRGVGSDITESRHVETRISYLANFDSLTGLANREQFQTHAQSDCEAAATDGQWRALLYIDLDGFKSVNDGFGHAAGDDVLREVARRLTTCATRDAMIARLGGDEFAIWLQAATPAKVEALADSIIELVGAPWDVHGVPVSIGASVGIAYTPKHGSDLNTLLGRADLALYRAKEEGRGHYRVFVEEYERSIVERRKLEADLKLALARNEFELLYQPLVDLSRGDVIGFEALLRWHSPTRGFVMPADFIPAAEGSNLIAAIGRWVLFRACEDAARWPYHIKVAVNVSPRQFRAPDFVQTVLLALKTSGLPPARLELEVTEGVFLEDTPWAMRNFNAMRERGIRISLDDFGTGYSSLSYLVAFPVDTIKIDRSFVRDYTTRPENQAIVDAILTIARRLSIHVVAEGVETKEQVLALKHRRCDDVQGYLFSRPRPLVDVPSMIEECHERFREVFPLGFESPLGLALAMKQQTA